MGTAAHPADPADVAIAGWWRTLTPAEAATVTVGTFERLSTQLRLATRVFRHLGDAELVGDVVTSTATALEVPHPDRLAAWFTTARC